MPTKTSSETTPLTHSEPTVPRHGQPIRLDLWANHEQPAQVFLNGRLACEVVGQEAIDRDTLEREVERARILQKLPRFVRQTFERLDGVRGLRCHVNNDDSKARQQFVRGLMEGWERKLVEHPAFDVPDIKPDHTTAYESGHDAGRLMRWCVSEVEQIEQEVADADED